MAITQPSFTRMQPTAVLITKPAVDFHTLIAVSHKALGRSIASACDASRKQQHDAERFLSMLASLRDHNAGVGLSPNLLNHVQFSVLIAADELDTIDILECAAGCPFVTTETLMRGVQLTVITGTLAQWRDAVVAGTRRSGTVQALYCHIMGLFEAQDLNPWVDFNKRWAGQLFLLEDKRK